MCVCVCVEWERVCLIEETITSENFRLRRISDFRDVWLLFRLESWHFIVAGVWIDGVFDRVCWVYKRPI